MAALGTSVMPEDVVASLAVVVSNGSAADLSSSAARIAALTDWVENADAGDAADLAERSRLATHLLKVVKGSGALALELSRLEMASLRRLGHFTDTSAYRGLHPNERKNAAAFFAAMADDAFADFVNSLTEQMGAITAYRLLRRRQWEEEERRTRDAALAGEPTFPVEPDITGSADDAAVAAEEILDALADDPAATTLEDQAALRAAARQLMEHMATASSVCSIPATAELLRQRLSLDDNPATILGLEQALRVALTTERPRGPYVLKDGSVVTPPKFVTYEEGAVGFVHVPWGKAVLVQLEFMAALRQRQSDDLRKASDNLNRLTEVLKAQASRRPEVTSVEALEVLARQGHHLRTKAD